MATTLQLHRLIPLLFIPFFLFHFAEPHTKSQPSGLYPVVLLPGSTCSQLEARLTEAYTPPSLECAALRKVDGRWFRLWKNNTELEDPSVSPCVADQLRLIFDHVADDYRNVAGVETRVLDFGSTRGFLADDDADRDLCMGKLIESLERAGYRDGETLFGAPYDFRQAPAAPGQPCRAFSQFQRRLWALIEHASRTNGNRPVVLVSHSQGGYFALEFLNRSPIAWRRKHVKHFVMASTGAGGFVLPMQAMASSVSDESPLSRSWRSVPSKFTALPSPKVFDRDMPLVITRGRNYTAHDIPEFMMAVGLPAFEVTLYETRTLPVAMNFRAPVVPTTCINGVGVPTVEKLVYWDGNFSQASDVVYGDGDGLVNLASILALDTVIGDDPRQEYYKSVKISGTSHTKVISDGAAVQHVVNEILCEEFAGQE
uniref:Lecithin-cholesterol acyltransferase-like 1 n=1 Tax=Leersia perrieri TaxID=77586 RepID=A0A0D9XI13_9ORYZ